MGAIAQWNRGKFGHVAYVAQVNGVKVTLEEYDHRSGHPYRNPARTIRAGDVENFIHFEG